MQEINGLQLYFILAGICKVLDAESLLAEKQNLILLFESIAEKQGIVKLDSGKTQMIFSIIHSLLDIGDIQSAYEFFENLKKEGFLKNLVQTEK